MQIPTMTQVESSNIAAIGHDGQHSYVRFKNGGIYRYHDVPAEKHAELAAAESVGKHLNQHFKGQHETVRITEDDPLHEHLRAPAEETSASAA